MKDRKLQGKKILVTGGAGFLGSHLVDSLLKKGAKVVVLDDLSTGKRSNLNDALKNSRFKFIKGDVNDAKALGLIFKSFRPDYAFQYAAVVGVDRTQKKPLIVLNDLYGIANFFALAKKYGVKKTVFASSSEVYGEPIKMPNREDDPLNPKTTYGVVKAVGEEFVKVYNSIGMPGVALRFFNVYGPRQDASSEGFVVGKFIMQALAGKRPTVFGDGLQTRDFVYVDDNVEAVIRSLMSSKTNGEVINIVRGKPCTIEELAESVVAIVDKNLKPIHVAPRVAGEIRYRHADGSKMKKLINFSPKIELNEGLLKTIEWYRG
ncbi:MAG: hypothetical protein A3E64_01965 [Candidatus Harrisonbacteria bacterium RIFCSPHIGHO2_12_FULL_48_16]|uniref:NAD-dependent epimerase/dehydratase domain-containing protein n=1 Tax=Candidatus Harrisonbacteria bacterium RIFCSPHIGHO2_12_FULL_48_16 TaxID=1798405 RepID=A0A1G1ZHA1_9BACT|nr:MAG: hypothetical protein A3E64_01965 [Candidatus Harrisonbacteria bacterium RIFCSPHIGHO2_12_FULL_48_16]